MPSKVLVGPLLLLMEGELVADLEGKRLLPFVAAARLYMNYRDSRMVAFGMKGGG